MLFLFLSQNVRNRSDLESIEDLVWKANLTGNSLPVSTGLTVVMRPLWVLTSGFTGAVVSTGGTVVTTTGRLVVTGATVVAGRVGCTVCSGRIGGAAGGCATGALGTVGSDIVGHGPFTL